MESLLTLSIGDYRAVELMLRLVVALVAGSALLLGLSTMCVAPRYRFPQILAAVALLMTSWFESSIARAWQGAFELAGSSYCVTGLPLAGEDRVVAWALGIPALLFCFGLAQLDRSAREFRDLCVATLLMALLGPIFLTVTVLGVFYSMYLLRGLWLGPSAVGTSLVTSANRVGLGGMVAALLLTMLGRLHLLPLGSAAETILIRGEIIRGFGDILTLVVSSIALTIVLLNLPEKNVTSRI